MTLNELRRKYLDFFTERGHKEIPSAPLIPENDPTTLFTGSGMQPLVPYLLGESHPLGNRLVNSQKSFRAEDIEEIGDNRHTTFFEMLGNWSLGDYFKREQLPWIFEFLTDVVGLDPSKLYVTVFAGDKEAGIEKDEESAHIWQELFKEKGIDAKVAFVGSEEEGYQRGMNEGERIFYYDAKKNWWSRAGVPTNMPAGEPGGPDSEIFYDFGTEHDPSFGPKCHPNCDCGRFMEIGNSVFMMYRKNEDDSFSELPKKNIDFGGGLERILAAKKDTPDVFKAVDVFEEMSKEIEKQTGKKYDDFQKEFRVILDHMRAAVFIIADGAIPSNVEQGYFARRLIRRSVLFGDKLKENFNPSFLVDIVIDAYKEHYKDLEEKRDFVKSEIEKEVQKFRNTLKKGLKEFDKHAVNIKPGTIDLNTGMSDRKAEIEYFIDAQTAFLLFTTYGFPIEIIEELATERGLKVDKEGFEKKMKEHKAKSRAGAEQKFKGGLADHSEKTTAFHTATHLMLAGLRKYLGEHVHQKGSNITQERTRFDFTHPEKVSREILDKVEEYVNAAIEAEADVITEEMPKEQAQADPTIEGSFWEKYPDIVKVWTIKDKEGNIWSRELCGGPHVSNTLEIAKFGKFKITKEKAVAAGVRRVKGVFDEK